MGSFSPNKQLLFDEMRGEWVKATPEEHVRQRWLKFMVKQLCYPKELLAVEKNLKELPHLCHVEVPDRRIDILCYGKGIHPSLPLYPLLLIECKDERLTQAAVDQVIGYNHYVKACFAAAVNLDEVQLGYFDQVQKKYVFCSYLPSFKELMQWIKR